MTIGYFQQKINLIRSFLTLKPDLVISDATLKLCQIFGISLLVLGYLPELLHFWCWKTIRNADKILCSEREKVKTKIGSMYPNGGQTHFKVAFEYSWIQKIFSNSFNAIEQIFVKGVSSKPSGKLIVPPIFLFLELQAWNLTFWLITKSKIS